VQPTARLGDLTPCGLVGGLFEHPVEPSNALDDIPQQLTNLKKRFGSMADTVFFFRRQLGQCFSQLGNIEHRIIAKSAFPLTGLRDRPF